MNQLTKKVQNMKFRNCRLRVLDFCSNYICWESHFLMCLHCRSCSRTVCAGIGQMDAFQNTFRNAISRCWNASMHWPQTVMLKDLLTGLLAKRLRYIKPILSAIVIHQPHRRLHNCHCFQAASRTCFDRSSIIDRLRYTVSSRACTPKQKIKKHSECTFTLWNLQYGIQSAMVNVVNVALFTQAIAWY